MPFDSMTCNGTPTVGGRSNTGTGGTPGNLRAMSRNGDHEAAAHRRVAGPTGTRFGEVHWFERLDSTNRYLLDAARSGAPEGLVVVADHQTAGRGRLGRRWEAPPGRNLLVSVLLRPDLAAGSRHLASAVVALAAADAIEVQSGVVPTVKWPNDLLAGGGGKLAGVLAETDLSGPGPPPVVVGVGMNVGWPGPDDELPDELAGVATSLARLSARVVDREALLDSLLAALEPRVSALAGPSGCDAVAGELRRRCSTVGRRVRVELADGSFEGTATDVTAEGHLVVDTGSGPRTVVAGDVVHLRTGDGGTAGGTTGGTTGGTDRAPGGTRAGE